MPRCIMCSNIDFLCKCLNLLYLIKELILCDLITRGLHISVVSHTGASLFLNQSHIFVLFPHLLSHKSITAANHFHKSCKRQLENVVKTAGYISAPSSASVGLPSAFNSPCSRSIVLST